MDWNQFDQQRPFDQNGPADASEQWVTRNMAAIANVEQQAGMRQESLNGWMKLFGFLIQNGRG